MGNNKFLFLFLHMRQFIFAATVGVASAIAHHEIKYMHYLAEFGKMIHTVEEFEARLANFIRNDDEIEEINASASSWIAGHNQFSDWHP